MTVWLPVIVSLCSTGPLVPFSQETVTFAVDAAACAPEQSMKPTIAWIVTGA